MAIKKSGNEQVAAKCRKFISMRSITKYVSEYLSSKLIFALWWVGGAAIFSPSPAFSTILFYSPSLSIFFSRR